MANVISQMDVAATYTPGDFTAPAQPFASTQVPLTAALGQQAAGPVNLPVLGLVGLVAVLLLLERRRIRLGR